jgi:hypothetical protein
MESMGYYEEYNATDYNFKNPTGDDISSGIVNITRLNLFNWLSKNYPNQINRIVKSLIIEISYYNKIINKDFGTELPKVKKPIKRFKLI